MVKIKENKTRKRFRIAQCILYLILIFMCTFPFVQIPGPDSYIYKTVFDMISYLGGDFPDVVGGAALQSAIPYFFIFPIIPTVGFFFCALDKERNLKNIASLICCLGGVLSILLIISLPLISLGSMLSLLLYILTSFITTIAMMARLTNDAEARPN